VTVTERHRVLREALRHYLEFKSYVSWTTNSPEGPPGQQSRDRWEVEYFGVRINYLDLQGCLRVLSQRKREAIFYNVIMDWKQKDVATAMGITTGSVNQYVEQGMIQIAADLWPAGEDAA
jgi:DNA-directed RNA polymerase specialized sigma24 family protein